MKTLDWHCQNEKELTWWVDEVKYTSTDIDKVLLKMYLAGHISDYNVETDIVYFDVLDKYHLRLFKKRPNTLFQMRSSAFICGIKDFLNTVCYNIEPYKTVMEDIFKTL